MLNFYREIKYFLHNIADSWQKTSLHSFTLVSISPPSSPPIVLLQPVGCDPKRSLLLSYPLTFRGTLHGKSLAAATSASGAATAAAAAIAF